jgi:hypothetical protein
MRSLLQPVHESAHTASQDQATNASDNPIFAAQWALALSIFLLLLLWLPMCRFIFTSLLPGRCSPNDADEAGTEAGCCDVGLFLVWGLVCTFMGVDYFSGIVSSAWYIHAHGNRNDVMVCPHCWSGRPCSVETMGYWHGKAVPVACFVHCTCCNSNASVACIHLLSRHAML